MKTDKLPISQDSRHVSCLRFRVRHFSGLGFEVISQSLDVNGWMFTDLPLLLPCGSQISACILEELLFASMLAELITSPSVE
jgi:hypothetical protein